MKLKVLMILEFAPDYRESFLRMLGDECELTVIAQSCDLVNLNAPENRKNYKYIETASKKRFGFFFQKSLKEIIYQENFDVICSSCNFKYLSRLLIFFSDKKIRSKWVWRGQVFGKNSNSAFLTIKSWIFSKANYLLTYSNFEAEKISQINKKIRAVSYNNSEVSLSEFRLSKMPKGKSLNLLFVGRYQQRKKIERLFQIAAELEYVQIRLVGPGMKNIKLPENLNITNRVEIFNGVRGEGLNQHFDWTHIVVNPGHLGLLVLNAARHNKAIVVDKRSDHAPEVEVAYNSHQPFIDFSNLREAKSFFNSLLGNTQALSSWANDLQLYAKKEYTIEHMVETHMNVFNIVSSGVKK